MKRPWNKGRLGRKGNNGPTPPGLKKEPLAYVNGLGGLRLMRLRPGQRPCAVFDDPGDIIADSGHGTRADERSLRRSVYERGPVTKAMFARMKDRFFFRGRPSRGRYLRHPRLRADVLAWARARLSHVPLPGYDTGAGFMAKDFARDCEAWLNANRWPVDITRSQMAEWLRELGFGARKGRWNCGFRTAGAPEASELEFINTGVKATDEN